MKRRQFIRLAAAGVSGTTLGLHGSDAPAEASAAAAESAPSFPWQEATVAELQAAQRSGKLTARSLVTSYGERIESLDRHGPALNAVIERNPEALAIAEQLDGERQAGRPRGPLHGIPVLIKDNIETADRMLTTAGSLALDGHRAARDAFIVRQLRAAGAIVLGKTNLSEWANFRSTRSSSGWSGRGGQTLNPYALDRNCCGSSSGSGVAVSANLCSVAIGTETNGSIVCPASVNGVVGIKPTVGLVSRSGIIPLAHSQDTAGPMARTVADAAALLTCLAGTDPDDDVTQDADAHKCDYTEHLDPQGLRGKRLGVVRSFGGFHPQVGRLLDRAVQQMKELGATLVDPAELQTRGAGRAGLTLMLYEFKADLNRYLAALPDAMAVRSLPELIEFNRQQAEREMPYFGQELLEMAAEKGALSDPEYQEARQTVRRVSREEGIDAALGEQELDALIAPTTGPAWLTDWVHGDRGVGGSSSPAARAGYPSITVPMGRVFGLPVGVSFFSRAYSEPQLIAMAFAFEQATGHRRVPGLRPHAEFG